MGQYNYFILIGSYVVYIITICIKRKITLKSTFFTLLFGTAIYFSISLAEVKGTILEGLGAVITIAMFISLLVTIIFVRSLYEPKAKTFKKKKEKIKKVKKEKTEEIKEEPVVVEKKTKKEPKPKKEKKQKEVILEEAIVEEVEEPQVVVTKKEEPQFVEVPLEETKSNGDDVVEQSQKEVTLKESIQLAKKNSANLNVNKQAVSEYIAKYTDVEINARKYMTSTGLPLADTHYRLVGDSKICFIYVYEIEGKSFMILRLPNKDNASKYIKKYGLAKSAFPKQPFDWYTVILSSKFKTNDEVFELIDEAYNEVG